MFEHVATLGTGAFGEVDLVRKRDSGVLFALKTLRKRDVLRRNQVAHVKAERDILAEADNEWVVKLYYSFQVTSCFTLCVCVVLGITLTRHGSLRLALCVCARHNLSWWYCHCVQSVVVCLWVVLFGCQYRCK